MAEKNNSSIPAQERNDGVQLNDELLDVTGGIGDIQIGTGDQYIDVTAPAQPSQDLNLDNVQTVTGGHKPPAGGFDGNLSF